MSSEIKTRDGPLARIPGWTALDEAAREMWDCSLATMVGAGNLGMATLYTPQPFSASFAPRFDLLAFAFHGTVALILLFYGATY